MKKALLFAAFGVFGCGANAGSLDEVANFDEPLSLSDGLMARYTFDSSNASDTSGRGHNGTLLGSPSFPLEHGGRSLLLNGTSQYVSVPNHADLSPQKLTVCAWVKPELLTWPGRVLEKGSGGAYRLFLVDAKLVFAVETSSGAHEQESVGTVRVHEWNHVCGTADGTNARIYINGQLDSTFAAAGPVNAVTEPLVLGFRASGAGVDYLKGYLDDVRIYNRALAASEVQALRQSGTLPVPAELAVQCAVSGDIYLNGHFTGRTCPATLSLPVAGHYWVGIGSASKGYQQQAVFTDGSSPVAVSFKDSNWLGKRTWKVLVFNVRNANLANGKQARLTDAEISAALASAKLTNTQWVIPYSRKLLDWQISSFTEETTFADVRLDDSGLPYLDTPQMLAASGHGAFEYQYDHIFFFYPAARATDGTAYGPCCGASTGGFKTQLPNTWGQGGWTESGGNSQIWLHEWLHSGEWQYGALMGWPVGIDGLHGAEEHGFSADPAEGWLPWYRLFMSGQVPESGAFVGLSPLAYVESTPLSRSILTRGTVSPAGKPGSPSASASSGKVTVKFSSVSGAVGYSVKRSTTSGGPYTRIAANISTTTYVDTAVTRGKKYYYVVVSTSPGGESASSSQVSATAQ